MFRIKALLIIGICVQFTGALFAQDDSCELRISMLTCSPGTELYSTFGHSALRVTDRSTGTDIVYNYGTFDFYDPNFLMKFTRGQLLYYLDQQNFQDFLNDYIAENRSVSEQVLNLTCEEKKKLQLFLFENIREENRYYRYDFLFDNCTTRLRDLVFRQTGRNWQTKNILPHEDATFRNHIHFYLNNNKQYWSKLGIDILLGKKMETVMNNSEAMFLPDYLEKGFDSSTNTGTVLVKDKRVLFTKKTPENNDTSLFTPNFVFWLLFGLIFILSFVHTPAIVGFLKVFDFIFYFILGLLGCFLIFMWVGTDHNTTQNNYNLLWALPTHLAGAFLTRKKNHISKNYFLATAVLSILLVPGWTFLPQELNPALIPITLCSGWRAWKIYQKIRPSGNS